MKIFISYRRNDTQDFAGRLADRLNETSGISHVFLDVQGIALGEDFRRRIQSELVQCSICIVVIGSNWCGASGTAQPRIFGSDDLVRFEVGEALRSSKRVLPVLANGADMPKAAALPDDLHRLPRLNALTVRHTSFDRDIDQLLQAIFDPRPSEEKTAIFKRHPVLTALLRSTVGALCALAVLLTLLVIVKSSTDMALSDIVGGAGPAIVIVVVVAALGALAPHFVDRRSGRAR